MRSPWSFFGPQPKQRLSGAYLSCKLGSPMRVFYSMREPLPIDEVLPGVAARIREGPALVLEPRRLAARTAARRVAQEMGERPGETVGYQVRFEDATGLLINDTSATE